MQSHTGQDGLTLIELLTTISIMVILLALVVPSFHDAFLNSKLTNQANGFVSSLILARSEAIKTNSRVTLCKSANGSTCLTTGGWQEGWIVFRDTNGNGSRDSGETLIQRGDPLATGFLLGGETAVNNYISFTSTGTPKLVSGAVQTGVLTLCRASPSVGSKGRQIVIGATGRVRIEPLEGMTACPPA
jgi:type IV fimbrial biogenesis protein FimT